MAGKILEKTVRESLVAQLEARGADVALYESLIRDYMFFWREMRAMQKDIKDRGRTYTAISAQGKEYEKENPSVKNAIMYSKQMIAILSALGLDTKSILNPAREGNGEVSDL